MAQGARDVARDIDALRAAIDELDHALIDLSARRLEIVRELFEVKRARGLPLFDPKRETDLLAERRAFGAERGLSPETVDALVRTLLDASHAAIERLNASANEHLDASADEHLDASANECLDASADEPSIRGK